MIRFGAFAGLPTRLRRDSARIWASAGFTVSLFDDVTRMVWEKLIMNVAFSGASCAVPVTVTAEQKSASVAS
jgi:2-dehydropantoate 2-reductase